MSLPLALLPLDDRPVNLDFPLLLAEVAGEEMITPPRALLGSFLTPGQPRELSAWLARALPGTRAAILSLDMLAYGGLVASRRPDTPAGEALRALDVLREIKRRHPRIRLLAFSVIMRLTITGSDPETRAAGRDIFRYSVLRDEAEWLGDARAAVELAAVEARIPPALLQAYLAARARNHAVNRAAVSLLGEGVLDFLSLVQEDTAPHGLHVAEQQALSDLARREAGDDRWRLYAGADETAQTLLARCLLEEAGMPFPVAVSHRDPAAAEQPALFEDVPLAETVRRHVDAAGGTLSATGMPLAVHTFTPPQPDLFEMAPLSRPTWAAALATFPRLEVSAWLNNLISPPSLAGKGAGGLGSPAVADVAYCNGGDPHLLDALLAGGLYPALSAYAGWNTAGNTLGTTLAHAALHKYGQARGRTLAMERAQRAALQIRLLDDGVYQPIVRAHAAARVEESGGSPLNLGERAAPATVWVNEAMQAVWREMRERYPALEPLDRPFRVQLPWGRLFEVHIEFSPDKEEPNE
ncbi:MAG: DUF4127 family protein [Armatimonadota bacterium]